MLTPKESEWLDQRDAIQFACVGYRVPGLKDGYDLTPDLADALEFEGRVAAELAANTHTKYVLFSLMACLGDHERAKCERFGRSAWECKDCRMMEARLTVEKEMDA